VCSFRAAPLASAQIVAEAKKGRLPFCGVVSEIASGQYMGNSVTSAPTSVADKRRQEG
jgi:hypothetical protein